MTTRTPVGYLPTDDTESEVLAYDVHGAVLDAVWNLESTPPALSITPYYLAELPSPKDMAHTIVTEQYEYLDEEYRQEEADIPDEVHQVALALACAIRRTYEVTATEAGEPFTVDPRDYL
jgi:hypothetical protein